MTGLCSLCRQVLHAEPDAILDAGRDTRTVQRYLDASGRHFMQYHPKEYRDAAGVGSACLVLALLQHVNSADVLFTETFGKMRVDMVAYLKNETLDVVAATAPKPDAKLIKE